MLRKTWFGGVFKPKNLHSLEHLRWVENIEEIRVKHVNCGPLKEFFSRKSLQFPFHWVNIKVLAIYQKKRNFLMNEYTYSTAFHYKTWCKIHSHLYSIFSYRTAAIAASPFLLWFNCGMLESRVKLLRQGSHKEVNN